MKVPNTYWETIMHQALYKDSLTWSCPSSYEIGIIIIINIIVPIFHMGKLKLRAVE